ncbi:6708_t:CDS:2 [Diversispora eburnea]|uniref:6708_t:CDS:1 n=1 Tax=Diversispora eburnea TaxID=1213867 RepID=A0A9N8ZSU9_9GLOM|nr:6708_t:CDS:2 [Diversispora eburnea]
MAASTLVELTIDYLSPEVVEIIKTQIPNLNSLDIRTTTLPLLDFISILHFTTTRSITLRHLQIECRYNVTPESLTALLEECKAPLKIISLDVEIFDDTLLEVIVD